MDKKLTNKEEILRQKWEEKGCKCRRDYIRCEKCHKAVSTRAKMAPEFALWIEECSNSIEIYKEKIIGRFLKHIGDPGEFSEHVIKNAGKSKRVGPDLYAYVNSYLEQKGF